VACDIIQFTLPPIHCQVHLYIGVQGRRDSVSMLHAESSENCGDIGFLTKTDPGTIVVFLDAEELARWAEVSDHSVLWELCLPFDCGFGSSLPIWQGDIVDIQKYQDTFTVEIEIGMGWRLCEPKWE